MGMASGVPPVLGLDVTTNPGPSMLPFRPLSFPAPGLPHLQAWQPPPPSRVTPVFQPANPLVLSALPRPPLVAGGPIPGPQVTGPCNIITQVRSDAGPVVVSQAQTFVLSPAPLNWSAPGAPCGPVAYPAPVLLATSPAETIMAIPAVGGMQAGNGGWSPALPPQVPPLVAQLAPINLSVNTGPHPQGAVREAGGPTTQSLASTEDSCHPKRVYDNFQRWQRFKALARRHLPQSPDMEALSCFFIPVLRTLAHLKPSMSLDEGLWRAMREWQSKSNFDRMIYYETAAKFMEFEAEEEMQVQQLQSVKGVQVLPTPAPPQPASWGAPLPQVAQQPACGPNKAGAMVQAAHKLLLQPLRPFESKAPNEIPPEAVNEYIDIMDALLGTLHSGSGEPHAQGSDDKEDQLEVKEDNYPDPGLLSYIDILCSQEDFITKVEEVIHPHFLLELLSPGTELDLVALAEELEQEEQLSLEELVEKRLLGSKEQGAVLADPGHHTSEVDSRCRQSVADQDTQRPGLGPQAGAGGEVNPRDTNCKHPLRRGQVGTGLPGAHTTDRAAGQQEPRPLQDGHPARPSQHLRYASSGLGSRAPCVPGETSVGREVREPTDGPSEDEEELSSLTFLLSSQHSLLPWGLPHSPVPASTAAQGAGQSRPPLKRGLSTAASRAAKSRKHSLCGGPAPADTTPLPGAGLGVSARSALPLGVLGSSLPQKRKCDSSGTGGSRKHHCRQ